MSNPLWPSDAIWRQRTGSTSAQVMACCLMAPSHYLNQCWLIISEVQWHSYSGNYTRDASTTNHYILFENYTFKISFNFPRGQWVNPFKSHSIVMVIMNVFWGSYGHLHSSRYLIRKIMILRHCCCVKWLSGAHSLTILCSQFKSDQILVSL